MAIPTTRTKERAKIIIHPEKCTGCGLCVRTCKDFSLKIKNHKVVLSDSPIFGCFGCGQCMAICPQQAIEIEGRTLSPNNIFDLPKAECAADYNQLLSLYQRRRSVRNFADREVEPELIRKILKAAQCAPMGLPPSDVNVLILDSKAKTHAFANDFCDYLESMKWLVSDWFLALMRPFWGRSNNEIFRDFVKPVFQSYIEQKNKGINIVNYDAPLAMYFYGSPYSDPADPIVAATAAMYACESLGLGTCMLGVVHPLIQNGPQAKKFREKHNIKYKSKEGLFVVFGYPLAKYNKGIERTFASVSTWE
ncbi:nitroreductase [Marinilabiliaceae bacterium JC017]|nr:nitroreductase [Marinilabiliaceae bacterium JC017]